jgi:hypothetical protein
MKMKIDPSMRIPPRPPRLPRDHFSMRPRLIDNAKAWWLLAAICALIGLYVCVHG